MNIFEYTKNLQMPLLIPNQSGKEITHNEALIILDNIILNSVISKNLSTPPNNIVNGDLYIVGENSENEWLGKEDNLAFYDNGWRFIEAKDGFLFFVKENNSFYVFHNKEWKKLNNLVSLNDLSDIKLSNLTNNNIIKYQNGNFINSDELTINKLSFNEKNILEFDEDSNLILKYFNNINENWENIINIDNNTGFIDFNKKVSFNGVYLEDLLGSNITQDDLNNKANLDLANVNSNVDYVVKQYKNGNNWYRKWRSGWVEQGGGFPTTVAQTTITLLVPFSDNNYFVSFQTGLNGAGIETIEINLCYFQANFKKNTDFNCQRRMNSGAASFNAADRWYACGY